MSFLSQLVLRASTFISSTMSSPLMVGGIVLIGVLSTALGTVSWLYKGALEEKGRILGEYEAFKLQTKLIGEKAEKDRLDELLRQRSIHDERLKSLEKRLASARARADQLCKSAGLSAGCSSLPPVPDTARPVDDSARDQRLLAVLQHAQNTTDRLIELQEWVMSNSIPLPHQ